MAKRTRTNITHKDRLKGLYGGLTASQEVARRTAAERQKEFATEFKRQDAVRVKHAAAMNNAHALLLETARRDKRTALGVRDLRDLSDTMRRRTMLAPKVVPHSPRIVADLGATVVAPYDFEAVLFSSTGSPANASSAHRISGQITSSIGANFNNASSASDAAAVGIFFHPPTDCPGTLRISSSVAFTFDWDTAGALASAHSDGWIGMLVERFNLDGFPSGVVIDQRMVLWSDDSWWTGAGFFDGSNSGFPLFAQFPVDNQHFFHIWVRCGGSISSAGWAGWFGSTAGSRIIGVVPSITWELS
jgi:hypothetical protein